LLTATLPPLSRWAFRNPIPARLSLLLIELLNAAVGTLLGACLWEEFFSATLASGTYLQLLLLWLLALVFFVRGRAQREQQGTRRLLLYALFCCNFAAYTLSGAIGAQRVGVFHPSGGLGSKEVRVVEVYDITKPGPLVSETQAGQGTRPAQTRTERDRSGTRFGYFLLFLLGLALAYSSAYLACSLSCSGYGLGAVLVVLLGTGILAGAFYFLGRALDKNMRLFKEMKPEERKREGRRYRRTWLGVVVSLALLTLIGVATGG
jgi:hypothetical protein